MIWLANNWYLVLMAFMLLVAAAGWLYFYSQFVGITGSLMPSQTEGGAEGKFRGDLGALGDYFGGLLNPIFAFLGLLMLLLTLFQSQKELSLSKEELRLTKEELKISNITLADQASTQQSMRLDSTFFSMLEHHSKLVEELSQQGQKGFLIDRMEAISNCISRLDSSLNERKLELVADLRGTPLDNYYAYVFSILKFLDGYRDNTDSSSNLESLSQSYVDVLMCFIPEEALFLLVLYTADESDDTSKKLRHYIDTFGMFEKMRRPKGSEAASRIQVYYCYHPSLALNCA